MESVEITKESVARQLVQKHEKALAVIREEFEKYSKQEGELDSAAEAFKMDRDSLNEKVQLLKDQRQNYYNESRALRQEFTQQVQKKKSMADIPMEVLILTKQIDQLEWEIQTEAMSLDDEKRLVKNIQQNIDKLHDYANKYQDLEEVSKAVKNLTSKLNDKLRLARERHEEMIKSVNTSDEKHKRFVEAVMNLRDARAKRIGFQHDLERHTKALEHWQKVVETEVARAAREAKAAKAETKPKAKDTKTKQTPNQDLKKEPTDKAQDKPPEKKPEQEPETKPSLESEQKTEPEQEQLKPSKGVGNGQ